MTTVWSSYNYFFHRMGVSVFLRQLRLSTALEEKLKSAVCFMTKLLLFSLVELFCCAFAFSHFSYLTYSLAEFFFHRQKADWRYWRGKDHRVLLHFDTTSDSVNVRLIFQAEKNMKDQIFEWRGYLKAFTMIIYLFEHIFSGFISTNRTDAESCLI